MKLKEVLDKTITFFRDKKIETPRLDAELLFAHGLKLNRIDLYLKFDQPLSESELAGLRELVRRRGLGESVASIQGFKYFFGYHFEVNSDVLIPRPETEHLIEKVLDWCPNKETALTIIDLGTGTGCVGLSLLKQYPLAKLIAVDISEKALDVAKRNALSLDVSDRVRFVQANGSNVELVLEQATQYFGKSKIDILVSNPPYIEHNDPLVQASVHKFEPHLALYAEDKGYALLKDWAKKYSPFLEEKALMLMEMGAIQGEQMKDEFDLLKTFNKISVIKDLAGHDRVICGEKNG